MNKRVLAFCVAATLCGFVSGVRADVDSVNKYIGEATELVGKGQQFFDDAKAKLDLADASMDDVPDAAKPALKAQIDALKAKIAAVAGAEDKAKAQRELDRYLRETEEAIGNQATWPGSSDKLNELLNDPATTAALGEPAVTAAKKKFATFAKVNAAKVLPQNLAIARQQVDELAKHWAERKAEYAANNVNPNGRDYTQDDLDSLPRYFKDLPADNADVKALQAQVDTIRKEKATAEASAGANEQATRIDRFLESYKNEFNGMDAETSTPTWPEFKQGKEPAHSLGLQKSRAYYTRMSDFITEFEKGEGYAAAKDVPAVKSKVDDIKKKLAAIHAAIIKNSESLVGELEKEKVNADNLTASNILSEQIRNALGQDSPEAKPLMARVEKAQKDYEHAGEQAKADTAAYYKSMTEQADKAWPAMMSKFEIAEGFDPNNAAALKGKYIKIETDNLMGYRFKPGSFPFATTINGVPVAGKYDPTVANALKEVEEKLHRGIGDSDDDGKWTVIAQVDGTTGQLIQYVSQSGDVMVDGSKVGTVEGRIEKSVDSPIVTIVALKAGPVAAAAGQGAVKADGSVAAPVASASTATASGGRGIFGRLIGLVSGALAVLIGAACLMKSKFAPLAGNAGAVQAMDKVGGDNLAYAGLAGVVLGVFGVLMNLVALPHAFFGGLIGLIASAAMIVAGIVVSRDFLEGRKLLPASVSAPLAGFAVPAGLVCAALGLLTIITSLF